MIYGNIQSKDTYKHLVADSAWDRAFSHLKTLNIDSSLGITWLIDDLMFVNVHTYSTKPLEHCRFESHFQTIDLQYIIAGGELINWQSVEQLTPDGNYDSEKDFQFYENNPSSTSIALGAEQFAVFFPSDGHQPQIQDQKNKDVLKAVVKLSTNLFN